MSDEQQSLFIVAYKGQDTADRVYSALRDLEKTDKIDIKTAATVWRKEDGKLKLKHKRRVTVWKGTFGGGAIGLVLAGLTAGAAAPAVAVGAGIGALIGSSRSGDRKEAKEFLRDKLGSDDSALVILVTDADWAAVQEAVEPFGGEELAVELTPEAEAKIAELSEEDEVVEAVADEVEIEEEEVVEV